MITFLILTVLPITAAYVFYRLLNKKNKILLIIAAVVCVIGVNALTMFSTLLLPQRSLSFIIYKLQKPLYYLSHTFKYCSIQFAFCCLPLLYLLGKRFYTKKTLRISFVLIVLTVFCIFLFFGVAWAIRFFPMTNPSIVVSVLTSGVKGFSSAILFSALRFAIFPFVLISFALVLICKKAGGNPVLSYNLIFFFLFFSCFSLYYFYVKIPVSDYVRWYRFSTSTDTVDSAFYAQNYLAPADVAVSFPQKKRNLILIFAESLEARFAGNAGKPSADINLIPHVVSLAETNINFSNTQGFGGGTEAAGTGITIAGMVASLFGIPYILPAGIDQNFNGIDVFLPGATGLTDILRQAGYEQRFLCGSDKNFAGRGALFKTHGDVEVHDIDWYKKNKKLPESYHVFWGFEDTKLYEFAKEELADLSRSEKPFMLSFLTVDTHGPIGYVCSECKNEFGKTPPERFKDVVRCADRQLAAFIEYCSRQDWFADTTLVVVADHLFHVSATFDHAFMASERKLVNLFINSAKEPIQEKNRLFTSFDMLPSILASMGVSIDGDALGFGRSLFSEGKTLPELYGLEKFNAEIMQKTLQYAAFY